jgi:hypothetical protein
VTSVSATSTRPTRSPSPPLRSRRASWMGTNVTMSKTAAVVQTVAGRIARPA